MKIAIVGFLVGLGEGVVLTEWFRDRQSLRLIDIQSKKRVRSGSKQKTA